MTEYQNEISRIASNVRDTLSAIESKGVTVTETATSDDMPGLVGLIPSVTLSSYLVTLASSGWSNGEQTVSVSGVSSESANNHVIVSPTAAFHDLYASCGIRCTSQLDGFLTFGATEEPDEDLTINVLVMT